MSKASVAAFAVLVMATAIPLHAGDPIRIFLVYDEQQIGDSDRALLLDALCDVLPRRDWRRVTVPAATSVAAVVDDYYDYWDNPAKEENPYPLSTAAIAYHIRRANKDAIPADDWIPAGTELRIPPLPVRAQWRNEENVLIRLYDPASQSYEKIQSLDDRIPKAQHPTNALADKNHPFRVARLTVFEIPDWPKFVEKLADEEKVNPLDLPNHAVLVKGEQKLVDIELFACDAPPPVSDPPPFTKEEVERFRAELPQRLAQKPPFPLWVIDWNIGVENGHGTKVLSVVHDVLDNLGLCALKNYVRTFDLNPRRNQKGLQALFTEYRRSYEREANFDRKTGPIAFAAAEEWINQPTFTIDEADPQTVPINEYVLQAVLWRFMYGTPKWVNMSFTLTYPQAQVLNAMYM